MKTTKLSKWVIGFTAGVLLLLVLSSGTANGQLIAVKKWTGDYPDMNDKYPLTFIAFKTIIPRVFIRIWPTHYYYELISVPVTDATEIAGGTKTGLLRIALKMLERQKMKGRHYETGQIKVNTSLQKEIEQKLFDSLSDKVEDNYRLAEGFIRLYGKLDELNKIKNTSGVRQIFEKEADELLMQFLMVNLLHTGQGEKADAFSEIYREQNLLFGEIDYTHEKIQFFNSYKQIETTGSYAFLSN